MSRSNASAKDAGRRMERLVADYLAATVDDRIDRAVKRGAKDQGDVGGLRFHGHKIAVECKDVVKLALPKWLREAEAERENLSALAGVVVHKKRGSAKPGDQLVTMRLDNLVALMTLNREHIEDGDG